MSSQPATADQRAARAAYEQLLRKLLVDITFWIVDEQFDPSEPAWRVNLIFQGDQGRWSQRRYRYDIPSDTIYFAGEQPLSDADGTVLRRRGRRL